MRERTLSWAINSTGDKVFIDELKDKDFEAKYNCPHCFCEVIPRRGDKKIWHFSHKGEECEYVKKLKNTKKDTASNSSLSNFMTKGKTIDIKDMDFEDSDIFTCVLCKKEENKEKGTEWSKKVWICKNCYLHLSNDEMKKLELIESRYN
ncbi:MAG: competence protein CoiA family protein [Candidatus Woesearchaeota archaeon]|jgi:competence CoiA-like predicted nuclease